MATHGGTTTFAAKRNENHPRQRPVHETAAETREDDSSDSADGGDDSDTSSTEARFRCECDRAPGLEPGWCWGCWSRSLEDDVGHEDVDEDGGTHR